MYFNTVNDWHPHCCVVVFCWQKNNRRKEKIWRKKLQNPTSNKNETPAPQGGKWPDETIIRYIIRACLLLIVFAWALVNLDAVLCFLGKVLALFDLRF